MTTASHPVLSEFMNMPQDTRRAIVEKYRGRTGMTTRSTLGLILMAAVAALAAACMQEGATPATSTTEIRSSVETVTWADGKAAYSIRCDAPGGCQQRAIQVCNSTFGNYQVLKSENMPTAGDVRSVRGPAAVVIRCG